MSGGGALSPCGRPVGDPCPEPVQPDSERGWPCCQVNTGAPVGPGLAPCGARPDEQCDPRDPWSPRDWCCLGDEALDDDGEPLGPPVVTPRLRPGLL